jgi:hypothetical protein
MNDAEFKRRIEIYKSRYAIEVSPPECETCHGPAELHDTQDMANYCENCLVKSFIGEEEVLISYTEISSL